MAVSHSLGFPRIGVRRELKKALESYWKGDIGLSVLLEQGRKIREVHWRMQQDAGLDWIPVGDFAWYDQMLNHSVMLGVVPERFGETAGDISLDTMFRMARGRAPSGESAAACEMTKWFDTNYHYIVPELHKGQTFRLANSWLLDETREALELGIKAKPVLIGPLTWLWLSKTKGEAFDRLELLESIIPVYNEVLSELAGFAIEWVQVDEPILVLDLPSQWLQAFEHAYNRLQSCGLKIMLATYFGDLGLNTTTVVNLPVEGLHIDLIRGPDQLLMLEDRLSAYKTLSLGVVDGRNIWRTDLSRIKETLEQARERMGDRLWIAPSCSLLHVPVDLESEIELKAEIKSWFAFARQKCHELDVLKRSLCGDHSVAIQRIFQDSDRAIARRKQSNRVNNPEVQARVKAAEHSTGIDQRQNGYSVRALVQQEKWNLPSYPTTTIGSFPQTRDIRRCRMKFRQGELSKGGYIDVMQEEIRATIARQEAIGLDVLVHGEPERNDMVEYFGELLDGFIQTQNGWVQSYGSRCVKPPIILGDINRPDPMTVDWSVYAQQQSNKPVKGMLTGPITILCWSFPRDDVPKQISCMQLALALRDEVVDLEKNGIGIIQIDEPAIREGLPLHKEQWPQYLEWAIKCFRIASSGVRDETQVHTHMCYSEFNDVIEYIAAMDADVITIETSRSDMKLLDVFESFRYPNSIGPGVYDIHSPNVPAIADMKSLLEKAAQKIPSERLWVNPDCGLKTRDWPEVEAALGNMVEVARQLREL